MYCICKKVRLLPAKKGKYILQFDKQICRKNNKRNVTLEILFLLGGSNREATYKKAVTVIEEAVKNIGGVCGYIIPA
ncbi:hypothetical protein CAP35_13385 [Chitinophagaceae bacterium IBVUCB1]|nr:hypothetical protein CAP35_13385 [Chitinophagaceae bacterium IBVUCB1]